MSYREKVYFLGENVVEVEQLHSYMYPQPGCRGPKQKPTPEEMARVNEYNRLKTIRRKAEMYFTERDSFVCLTYDAEYNPDNIRRVKMDFTNFIKKVKRQYAKLGIDVLIWMRNIERIKENKHYHIHLILPFVEGCYEIIKNAWKKGYVHFEKLLADYDYEGLVKYITKTPETDRKKKIGESDFSLSHNMPLPDPVVTKFEKDTWEEMIIVPPGYYLLKDTIRETKNDAINYRSRSYTLIRDRLYGNVIRCGLNTSMHSCPYLVCGKLCRGNGCCSFEDVVVDSDNNIPFDVKKLFI